LWYLLQSKRLLKKPSFLVLLGLLPLLVLGLRLTEAEEHGMLRIAVCAENPQDVLSTELVNELLARRSLLSFVAARDVEEAYALVRAKQADAAWIFPDNMQAKVNEFAAYRSSRQPLVLIVEREDNVALQLSREVLYGTVWRSVAYALYRSFILENFTGTDVNEGEIAQFFHEITRDSAWLQRDYLDYEPDADTNARYLTAPLRGILSLFVVLCGLASCLYYKQDQKNGLYLPFSPCYHLPAVLMGGLGVLVALALTGFFTRWYWELLLMGLLVLAVIAFTDLLRLLLGKAEYLAAAIPLVVLMMLVLCPVFFTIRTAGIFPWLLPPFYYLNASYNHAFAYYLGYYVLALWGLRGMLRLSRRINPA
jgi:ABC-2 type transport system permease protein